MDAEADAWVVLLICCLLFRSGVGGIVVGGSGGGVGRVFVGAKGVLFEKAVGVDAGGGCWGWFAGAFSFVAS